MVRAVPSIIEGPGFNPSSRHEGLRRQGKTDNLLIKNCLVTNTKIEKQFTLAELILGIKRLN